MVEQPVELGEVNVDDPPVTTDDDMFSTKLESLWLRISLSAKRKKLTMTNYE